MRAAPPMIWELAGRPPIIKPLEGRGVCGVCARPSTSTGALDKILGNGFADRPWLMGRTGRICPACTWCCSGKPPTAVRLWTVVAAPGRDLGHSNPKAWLQDTPGLLLTSRANTGPVVAMLTDPPEGDWVVSVSLSGQRHVLPYATINRGRGRWQVRVEDHTVSATPEEFAHVHFHARALRGLGLSEQSVLEGCPDIWSKDPDAAERWHHHNQQLTKWLASPLLSLALWTITKGTMQ